MDLSFQLDPGLFRVFIHLEAVVCHTARYSYIHPLKEANIISVTHLGESQKQMTVEVMKRLLNTAHTNSVASEMNLSRWVTF